MPFDEGLAHRLSKIAEKLPQLKLQKMFGGIGYMLNGNMCVGIYKEFLVLRLGIERAEKILDEPHSKPMDLTGKVMKGWVMVAPDGMAEDAQLRRYVDEAVSFVETLEKK